MTEKMLIVQIFYLYVFMSYYYYYQYMCCNNATNFSKSYESYICVFVVVFCCCCQNPVLRLYCQYKVVLASLCELFEILNNVQYMEALKIQLWLELLKFILVASMDLKNGPKFNNPLEL